MITETKIKAINLMIFGDLFNDQINCQNCLNLRFNAKTKTKRAFINLYKLNLKLNLNSKGQFINIM